MWEEEEKKEPGVAYDPEAAASMLMPQDIVNELVEQEDEEEKDFESHLSQFLQIKDEMVGCLNSTEEQVREQRNPGVVKQIVTQSVSSLLNIML